MDSFPYLFVLKIWPNTDMAQLALAKRGVTEAIAATQILAYHEASTTSPFDKSFTSRYQADLNQ